MTTNRNIDSVAKADLFLAVMKKLESKAVPYCILGGYENYPDSISSDVDFMVSCQDLEGLHGILRAVAEKHDAMLVQAIQHETTACYYILAKFAGTTPVFLHPDASSDYRRNGRVWISAEQMLSKRRLHPKGFYIPAPEDAFLYYLVKKIDKRAISDEQGGHLTRLFCDAPEFCLEAIEKIWPEQSLALITVALQGNDWNEVRANLNQLARELQHSAHRESFASRFMQWLGEIGRKIKRVIQPTGLFVVFLGPDGCGKSSVIKEIVPAMAPAFRRTEIFHLRPSLGRQKSATVQPVTAPQGKPPRFFFSSIAKIFYFLFDYVLGYFFVIRPKMVRSTLVVFDRYYHDLLVDPRRYRYGGPMWFARWVVKLIPKPDFFILLDAPAEVIQARKQEVPFAETAHQREAYLELVRGMKNEVVVVDASQPLEKVIEEVCEKILDFMSQRTAKRFNLD